MDSTLAVAKDAKEFQHVGSYPLLDRTLGHKLLENARGSKFSLDFQALRERCQKVGKQPSGRALLWFILNKYNVDKDRGASLSQHHLLSLKLHGKDVKALEEFRQRMLYIVGSLEQSEMPQESALCSMLYEDVKRHPLMALAIDKFRCAREGSSKRTSQWLMERINETIELVQQDENTTHVEKALQKRSKTPKQETSKDDVNAAAKGKGKGKDDKGKKGQEKEKEKMKKKPCTYCGYDSCNEGNDCPYSHDLANKYQGPKPRGLQAKSSGSHAGAAAVIAATCLVSEARPSGGCQKKP